MSDRRGRPEPRDCPDLRAFLAARVLWALREQRALAVRQGPRGLMVRPDLLAPPDPSVPRAIPASRVRAALLALRA